MISKDEWDRASAGLWEIIEKTFNSYKPKPKMGPAEETAAQNIVVTLTPEALMTILICVGAAEPEKVASVDPRITFRSNVKPASVISLYHTLRNQAREAKVIDNL